MKKIAMMVCLLIGLFSLVMPVKANGIEGVELLSKSSYMENETLGKYKIELKVPGVDGDNRHDEVILMVDGSYSLDEEWPQMKKTIVEIGKTILNGNGNTQLTLMAFGMGDNEVLTHVKDVYDLEKQLGELPGTLLYGRSSTNCEAGFTGVMEYIDNHDETLNNVYVVYISDGRINTDETPHNFYNWRNNSWLRYTPSTIIGANLENEIYHIMNGGTASTAFTTVFGNVDNLMDILTKSTDEEKNKWADMAWDLVYEAAGLEKGTAYPVSDVERAFVSYDKNNGTYLQDLFYYALIGRKYPNMTIRTQEAGTKLANMEQVNALYVVDYDNYSAWMDTGIKSDKANFIKADGISGLYKALENVLVDLSSTPFNDVVIEDYMSKWVNLDVDSFKIVDDTNGEIIYTINDGWLVSEDKRPVDRENPIIVENVIPVDYVNGGNDVIGNTNGDIYKVTWYVKDGAMLRSENYHLEYMVIMDVKENNFEYNKNYKTNGNTSVTYKDDVNNIVKEEISVPVGMKKNPSSGKFSFSKGSASHIAFLYVDAYGNVNYSHKIDFGNKDTSVKLPYKDGYVLAVFVKQAKSGMIWTSNQVSGDVMEKIILSIKKNDKAYKGHDAIAYGNGNHILTYTNGNKKKLHTVVYNFE